MTTNTDSGAVRDQVTRLESVIQSVPARLFRDFLFPHFDELGTRITVRDLLTN